jgi:hypothetical protein
VKRTSPNGRKITIDKHEQYNYLVDWHDDTIYILDLTTMPNCPDPWIYIQLMSWSCRLSCMRPNWGVVSWFSIAVVVVFSVFGRVGNAWQPGMPAGPHVELASCTWNYCAYRSDMHRLMLYWYLPYCCLLSISRSWTECPSSYLSGNIFDPILICHVLRDTWIYFLI